MNQICILQVEDDENDVYFLKRAFQEAGLSGSLQVVKDGQEAIDYLSGKGPYGNRQVHPYPTLVLLDLKMPRKSGFDVLKWVRQQPHLRSLVVIVFSSSAQPLDVSNAYELGANSFVVKPASLDDRVEFVNAIRAFWLTHNVVPEFFKK